MDSEEYRCSVEEHNSELIPPSVGENIVPLSTFSLRNVTHYGSRPQTTATDTTNRPKVDRQFRASYPAYIVYRPVPPEARRLSLDSYEYPSLFYPVDPLDCPLVKKPEQFEMASCGGSLVKIILVLFNGITLLLGGVISYLGFRTMNVSDESFEVLFKYNLKTGALVLLGVGLAIVLISLLGFCGSCCNSSCLLNVYGGILFVLLVVYVASGYYGYQYQDDFKTAFNKGVRNGIQKFYTDPEIAAALQTIQLKLKCCGWEGPSDYGVIRFPSSCCAEPLDRTNPSATCSIVSIKYTDGCKESPVLEGLTKQLTYSYYSLILIQIVIIIASCCLAREFDTRY